MIDYDLKAVRDEVEMEYSQNTAVVAAVDVSDDEADQGMHTVKVIHCSLTLTEKVVEVNSLTVIPCERMISHSSKGVRVSYAAWLRPLVLLYGNLQKRNVCYVVTLKK